MKSNIPSYTKEILIIDTDDYRARNHSAFLSTHGYKSAIANSFDEAILLLKENFYPIIIIDKQQIEFIKEAPKHSTCHIIGKPSDNDNNPSIKIIETPVKIELFIRTIHLSFLSFIRSFLNETDNNRIKSDINDILNTPNIKNRSIEIEVNLKLTKYISRLKKLL